MATVCCCVLERLQPASKGSAGTQGRADGLRDGAVAEAMAPV